MYSIRRMGWAGLLAVLAAAILPGCGKQAGSAKTGPQTTDSGSGDPLVSASIAGPDASQHPAPEKGSPEWILAEIRNLRAATIDPGLSANEIEKARNEQ